MSSSSVMPTPPCNRTACCAGLPARHGLRAEHGAGEIGLDHQRGTHRLGDLDRLHHAATEAAMRLGKRSAEPAELAETLEDSHDRG